MTAAGAALASLFSDHVLRPVLSYWYHVYNMRFIWFLPR